MKTLTFPTLPLRLPAKVLTATCVLAMAIAVSLILPMAAVAEEVDQDDAIRMKQSGEILPLEEILETAGRHHKGKVIGVELEREHHTLIYEIKILDPDGELWEIKINAKDGKLLQDEEDD